MMTINCPPLYRCLSSIDGVLQRPAADASSFSTFLHNEDGFCFQTFCRAPPGRQQSTAFQLPQQPQISTPSSATTPILQLAVVEVSRTTTRRTGFGGRRTT